MHLRSHLRSPLRSRPGSAPAALAAALLLLGVASSANADSVTIDFDFSGSSITALSGNITVPPDGSINAASAQATFSGNVVGTLTSGTVGQFTSVTVLTGPATLDALSLDATIDATVAGLATATGSVFASLPTPAPGTFDGSTAQISAPFQLFLDVFVDCSGFGCGFVGTFPIDVSSPQSVTQPLALPVNNVQTPGAATVSGVVNLSLGTITATVNLVGQEVGRTAMDMNPIPEPGTLALLGGGLVGLAGLVARTRRG